MRVTVGVCGGIAAYKAAELVRALQRQALEVHVVMTEAATKFVQPLTFAALSGHKVITGLWDDAGTAEGAYDSSIEHIGEAQWAEALVVAPATANILAKFAHGIADDFLTTMYLATTAPVLVAPAMNVNMWNHPATQANLEILRQRGVRVVEPGTGDLACGMVRASRWTPSALSATAPAAKWATPWPKPRTAAEPKSFSLAGRRPCIRPRTANWSKSPRQTRCARPCWSA